METDHSAVMGAFNDESINTVDVGIVAKEFRLKRPPGPQVSLVKVDRKCNMTAHALYQTSCRKLSSGVLVNVLPTCASRLA
jgi:hypothetical protein